ncbi:MAG: MATE family efflux transporter [Hyphomicrobiales bacterium]|nr:MAG: MATE family efflux transporter [Hyphomicrobiales bacterium]
MSVPPPSAGREPVGHRTVLAIALPIVLSNVSEPLISVVDTAIIGRLDAPHLIGAIALAGIVFAFIYWMFGFLRMGTTGLTAQAFGAGDGREVLAVLLRVIVIALTGGALLIVLQWPISLISFSLTEGSALVEGAAADYFAWRIWGAPAALLNFAILGWFIGLGKARIAFILQLTLNLTNIALDALFVLVFDMSVLGVALGTVIAELVAALAGAMFVLRELKGMPALPPLREVLALAAMKRMFGVNRDLMIRSVFLISAFAVFTSQGAKAGDVTLAANAVLFNFFLVIAYFLDGFAFAAEALAGRSIGARDRDAFGRAVFLSTYWAVWLSLIAGAIFWLAGTTMIDIMSVNEEVRASARSYLIWAALTPLTGIACFQLDGIFTGALRTGDMRNMMVLSFAAYIGLWALLTPLYGNHGLWLALNGFFVIRGLTLGARYPALVRASFGPKTGAAAG